MDFYKTISDYYELIFQMDIEHANFIRSYIKKGINDGSVLDIGCATGDLTIAVSEYFKEVHAIDLDDNMIKIAENKLKKGINNVSFTAMDMLKIDQFYKNKRFDIIFCFGNTLAHLLSYDKINEAVSKMKKLLQKSGILMLQILNYDNIINNRINKLPVIDNNAVRFDRYYDYFENRDTIDFRTELSVKKTGIKLTNSIALFPVKKETIKRILSEQGFKTINFYSNFNKAPYNETSLPLIITAE